MQRIEPYGWDRHDRTYYVLDDNRLYRLTEAPPPPPKPKKNTKKARAALRTSKRRRTESGAVSEADDAGDEASEAGAPAAPEDDGLGGMKWECLAVNLAEVRQFLSTIEKTKDPNEKILRDQIQQHLVPILEKQEESKKRKQLQKEKELLALEKLANAKRSSRIASKLEQKRLEEQAREEERKRREEEEARRKAELQRLKMERERDKRIMAREMRLREREARRRLHEEELAQLSEDGKAASSASSRMSERRRLAEIERAKKALEQLEQEEEDWIFDCICGVYGRVDDGTHSVACERCNTWQHSKCLGIKEEEAEREDFHFICSTCRRREEQKRNQLRPRIIKLKVHRDHDPAEPVAKEADKDATELQGSHTKVVGELQSKHPDDFHESSVSRTEQYMPRPSTQEQGTAVPDTQRSAPDSSSMQPSAAKQTGNPFASLYPSLLPPDRQLIRSSAVPLTNNESASRLVSNNQYLGLAGDEAKSTGSALSLGVEGGSGISPSKQPSPLFPSPTKPALPGLASSTGTVPTGSATIGGTISIKTPLPQLAPVPQPRDASPESGSSPLPPSSAGLSPVKQSPPQHQANGTSANSAIGTHHPTASVFPPVAALSPSPRQQILTPPVKPAELVRLPPPQLSQNMPTPRLVPSPPSQH